MTNITLCKDVGVSKKSGKKFVYYYLEIQKLGQKPIKFVLDFKKQFAFSYYLRSLFDKSEEFQFNLYDSLGDKDEN